MKFRIPFLMTCDDFQLGAGAEPHRLSWSQRLHQLWCDSCRAFATDTRRLDRRLLAAFKLDLNAPNPDQRPRKGPRDNAR